MRQLTPVTNLVLACLLAAGLLPALGLPFFGAAPKYESEGIERNAEQVANWFTAPADPISGADALGAGTAVVLGVAAATVALAILMAPVALRRHVRDLLRIVPMLAPALVLFQLVNQPGAGAEVEVRWGLFAAAALAALMASAAFHGASLPDPKPAPKPYSPPPVAGSQAPPGT